MRRWVLAVVAGFALAPQFHAATNQWQPAKAPLMTKWAKEVSPQNAHPGYPRPQLVRKLWANLNGLWDYAVTHRDDLPPDIYQGQILVPFPVESALSGVMRTVYETNRVWYRRNFEIPKTWAGQRVLLHFGAVDFETAVFVNAQEIGKHRGGYDPFTFDITEALQPTGTNLLIVSVWDPTDAGPYPRGKQVRKPDRGIFYTATSGIWQTVWLEAVPETFISNLRITPDLDGKQVRIQPIVKGATPDHQVDLVIYDKGREVARSGGVATKTFDLLLKYPKIWSPNTPFLYDVTAVLRRGEETLDTVTSYFGMRKISLGRDSNGVTRVFLNNQQYFMLGPLDQGFWPDGLYTAPTDEAMAYDIQITKKLGFNMIRKHVKVEPERWYHLCDQIGLLVWQDMPSGDKFIRAEDPDIKRSEESAQEFESELKAMMDAHYHHPSIVMWVIFNEGWGQYDTARLATWAKEYDPTRLVNSVSGWADRGVSDVFDWHRYPGPGSPMPESNRAAVLGEYGGLGFKVDGHTWAGSTWGYRGMENVEKLMRQYVKLMRRVYALNGKPGLSAAVYTQTTDVEYEGNGLLTYDREVIKMNVEELSAANRGRFMPEPKLVPLAAASNAKPVQWRYTTDKPADDWMQPNFNDSRWKEGPGGFGSRGTPNSSIGTDWHSGDIWLRREVTLREVPLKDVRLLMHHDEDAEVYLNGELAAKARGYITEYDDFDVLDAAARTLKPGRNVIAVHCHQTRGGQYIDVGLYRSEK